MSIRVGAQTTRKHVLNKQGFSLVEICVAMGIGAVLILSLAQYSLSAARSQKSQNLSNEFNEVMGTVGQALMDQSICTSMLSPLTNQIGAGSTVPLVIPHPGSSPQVLLQTGSLPSGLNVISILAGAPTSMGSVSPSYTAEMLPITISAMKGTPPSPAPSNGPGLNTYFMGNNYFTKTFTVAVWVDNGTGLISKCISSQDMAQEAPAPPPPSPYPSSGITCPAPQPTCPGPTMPTPSCCTQNTSPTPFWVCNTTGWSCS
jgi:type II secretory pathway pseudopilin PulG